MGMCPCVRSQQYDKYGKGGEFSLMKAKEEEKALKAAIIIQRMFRKHLQLTNIEDTKFLKQNKQIPITNELILKRIKEIAPFKFNRIVSNAPRELRSITNVPTKIIYSGYW